jgi:hypothetical protein
VGDAGDRRDSRNTRPTHPAQAGDDAPPYFRYAFLNPYNLSLVVGAATTAAASGHWGIGVCAAAAEAIWLLFAPDSKVLRSVWFDKVWAQTKKDEYDARQNERFLRLTPQDQGRAAALRDQRTRIYQLAAENPSLTVDLMQDELAKLDDLLEDFLELALVCARCETQLGGFDLPALQRSWQFYEEQVKRYPPRDDRHEVAEKNLEVLRQRRERMDAMKKSLQTARGHMDLMENSFRLLGDEIVTMADPSELAARLDDLRIGVQAIRESSQETEALYEDVAEEPLRQMRQ